MTEKYDTGAVHRWLELPGITGYIPAVQFPNAPEKYGSAERVKATPHNSPQKESGQPKEANRRKSGY